MLGLRVIEWVSPAGEYAGRLLADIGFEVVKIEPPGLGSLSRRMPPLWDQSGEGVLHLYCNARKQSVTLDVSAPGGDHLLDCLLGRADALLMTSDQPVDPSELARRHPHLIIGVAQSFPPQGKWGTLPAEDLLIFAAGGLMYLSGEPEGEPVCAPGWQSYIVGGAQLAFAMAAAFWSRPDRGAGGEVVYVCYQAALAAQENVISDFEGRGHSTPRTGSQHRTAVPGRVYPCRDGFVHFMVSNAQPGSWERFLEFLGNPPELADSRLKDAIYRREHVDAVDPVIERIFADKTREELVTGAQRRHLPCAPVQSLTDLCHDPHLLARGFLDHAVTSSGQSYPMPAPGIRLPDARDIPMRWAPTLGADNRVLKESADLDDTTWAALAAAGTVSK